jgi:hypothetical protein
MNAWLIRTSAGFAPDDEAARRLMRRIPKGTSVEVSLTQPRSAPQLRFYWRLCEVVAMNHEQLASKNEVDQLLRILSGHVDIAVLGDEVYKLPRRIAFAKLGQAKWAEYLEAAKRAVAEHLLPGVSLPELEDEVLRMLG